MRGWVRVEEGLLIGPSCLALDRWLMPHNEIGQVVLAKAFAERREERIQALLNRTVRCWIMTGKC
jgi:hypothetical protein